MKIKISNSTKWIISAVLVVCIGVLGIFILKNSKHAATTQQERIKYQYTYGTGVDYAVNLKPNILYEENKLLEDQTYIAEFINNISANFRIKFEGQGDADIQGEYSVIAQITGYTHQEEVKKDIWKKEFVLAEPKAFEGKETYNLEKAITINFHQYNALSKAIIEASKVNIPVELRVTMRGNLVATNAHGTINKPIETSLILPLGSNYFTISKAGVGENVEAIKEIAQVPMPTSKKVVGLYIGGIILAGLLLAGVWLLTSAPTEEDLRRRDINKILTAHGSRMVGVDEIIETSYKEDYEVGNIEDLVKIADELEKPLIYQYSKEVLDIDRFYVMDQEVRYSYRVKPKELLLK